jgi:hypothetical protein
MIGLLFVIFRPLRAFLLPGIMAACVAGSANIVVARNYPSAVAHSFTATFIVFLATLPAQPEDVGVCSLEKGAAIAAWVLLAVVSCYVISETSWPYALDKSQMLLAFCSRSHLRVVDRCMTDGEGALGDLWDDGGAVGDL